LEACWIFAYAPIKTLKVTTLLYQVGKSRPFSWAIRTWCDVSTCPKRYSGLQADADAQYQVEMIHENSYGIPSSAQEAKRWFRKAAGQGHTDAAEKLKEIDK
jgi:TPR repeat protein